jgi:putative spermidine/putrescine transport system substrate-binding protein
MNMKLSTNRKFTRMFANILSIVVILTMAFPAMGSAYAAPAVSMRERFSANTLDLDSLVVAAQEEGALTVIALPNDWCNFGEIIAGFTDMYGIPVNSVAPSASSEDELQAIRDGGLDSPDVIDVGPSFAEQAKTEGLITPYQVSTWGTIPDFMKDSVGYWYGDYYGVMSIAANTAGAYTSPTSWDDLLNGSNVGPTALGGDPTVSNMGFFSVYAAALANGGSLDEIEPGLNFFRDLNNAGRLLPGIGNGTTLTTGETPVLPEWSYLALAQRDANPDAQIEVVVPPNSIASFYAQAISASAPHPNAARLWMEYLYSDAGQLAWLEGYCFPARFDDLLARDAIPGDLLAGLPDITGAVFPSLDQIVAAKAFVEANWNCIVYGNGCPPTPWRDESMVRLGKAGIGRTEIQVSGVSTMWPGFLRIYASNTGTPDGNLLLREAAYGDFMIKTRLFFEPDTDFQFAGLVIWQDEYNFLQFGRAFCDVEGACVGNGLYFDKILGGEFADGNFATSIDNPSDVFLRLERRGDMVRAFYSADEGISWYEIGTHWIPSDFVVNGVGLTASQDFNTPDWDIPADFDFFELTEGWGFLPEGFHDYDEGDVPNWACNAGGWAADPDNREADVNIEGRCGPPDRGQSCSR